MWHGLPPHYPENREHEEYVQAPDGTHGEAEYVLCLDAESCVLDGVGKQRPG